MINPFVSRLTTKAKKALIEAQTQAAELGYTYVGSEHLLYGIMLQKGSIGAEILRYAGIRSTGMKHALVAIAKTLQPQARTTRKARGSGKKKTSSKASRATTASSATAIANLVFSEHAKLVIEKAFTLAFDKQHAYVGTEHLLHGIMQLPDSGAKTLLQELTPNIHSISQHVGIVLNSTSKFHDIANINRRGATTAGGASGTSATGSAEDAGGEEHTHDDGEHGDHNDQMPHMKEYKFEDLGMDLSDENLQKKFDDVIGREQEIERIVHILNRRTKNNPLLIGEPGVGKTAIVEGLAKKIARGDVPDSLSGKRIFQLDLTSLVAGTMYRGEFEDRLKKVIEAVKKDTDIILFIDEIHNIIGTGSVPGSLDAANIIKPALARGEIRCIGATTIKEFKQHIEKDSALERRFQQVIVEEPTPQEAKKVLAGIKQNYELYHQIEITNEAIDAAVELSMRYLPERFLPDKAVDLIDEAASKMRTRSKPTKARQQIKEIQTKLKALEKMKQEAILEERFSHADLFKQRQEFLAERLAGLLEQDKKNRDVKLGKITQHDIAEIISMITKIPVTRLLHQEKEQLLFVERELEKEIVGQHEAISAIARSIRRQRAGISNPQRPIGSFLFLGPTGVGKTELAKVLSRVVFNDEKALIRIDMSEFRERFNISKLIGAPAGYVGYEEGGNLTERIRRKPYAVVLFDEIEKAHPDVWNLLLQILEDGTLTDAAGRKANFKNTIIIMTSNLGSKELMKQTSIGFEIEAKDSKDPRDTAREYKQMKKRALEHAKKSFRPEFLNRIDHVVVFGPLSKEAAETIVDIQLEKLKARLTPKQISLVVDAKAKQFLLDRGFKKDQGARPLRHTIQRYLEDVIAERIISQDYREQDHPKALTIKVTATKKGLKFS